MITTSDMTLVSYPSASNFTVYVPGRRVREYFPLFHRCLPVVVMVYPPPSSIAVTVAPGIPSLKGVLVS